MWPEPDPLLHRPRSLRQHVSRHGRTALIALGGFLALVLVAFSPLFLRWLTALPEMDWALLTNIGQTYGAASALLSAIALGGVAASLIYQAHEAKIARHDAMRTAHFELVRMSLEEPLYMACWGGSELPAHLSRARQIAFANLITTFWWHTHTVTRNSESFRLLFADFFKGEIGRTWWASGGRTGWWKQAATEGVRSIKAWKIVEEEHNKALATGPPRTSYIPTSEAPPASSILAQRRTIFIASLGSAAGAAVFYALQSALGRKRT
jgi:hypothetical protein